MGKITGSGKGRGKAEEGGREEMREGGMDKASPPPKSAIHEWSKETRETTQWVEYGLGRNSGVYCCFTLVCFGGGSEREGGEEGGNCV